MAYKTVEISEGVYWVGVQDWNRRSFDEVMSLPLGSSYNCYLVHGSQKTALIDTVHKGFTDEFIHKLSQVTDISKIDYLVMNHAEPDHGGSIPRVMALAPNAKLLATEKGIDMAAIFHGVVPSRAMAVSEAEPLDLGGKVLRFVPAPWLHWPETMFTFLEGERILFPCDFFATHVASDLLYADEVGGFVLPNAKLYYAVIMMPYAKMAAAGLAKAVKLDPRIIAPSHGPVWRDSSPILDSYTRWTQGQLSSKAIVPYVTMWGSTQRMAEVASASLSSEGIETIPFDLPVTDMAVLARELVDASAIVLGSPTVLGGVHPLMTNAISMIRLLRPRARLGAFFGSYGWGGGAEAQVKAALEASKMEIVDSYDLKGPPSEKDLERVAALARNIASRIRTSLLRS